MFEIQCGKKQQDDRVCMGHFWICGSHLGASSEAVQNARLPTGSLSSTVCAGDGIGRRFAGHAVYQL